MALKDITQNTAYQARQGTTATTSVNTQTVQPQQVTTPASVQTPIQAPVPQSNKPINKVTGQVAGANKVTQPVAQTPQQPVQQNIPNTQPVEGDYSATNPNAQGVSQYTFNESAKQLNAQDPNYLNNRDDYIANQIVNQLNSLTKQ